MKIYPVSKLNRQINSNLRLLIEGSEKYYRNSLSVLAKQLAAERKEKPIILLSGPSGSAKTTTAYRLKMLLDEMGYFTHVVSMDNYFRPLAKDGVPLQDLSKIDLEAPTRVDQELLGEHLEKIWRCEAVDMPIFDFAAQDRRPGGILQRNPDELIILEGIHALNPDVTGAIQQHSTGLYVSVRTRLSIGDELLHPEKIRLMRRLMRDHQFRGRKITDILTSYLSVQRGEELYIMPHKHRARHEIDTFMPFEAAVYKEQLLPLLLEIPESNRHFDLIRDVIRFLTEVDGAPVEIVPPTSIVREFAGGGVCC